MSVSPQNSQGNGPGESQPETWGFTRTHRIGVAMLVGIIGVLLGIQWGRHPARLDDPVVIVDGTQLALDPRIDPNLADAVSLSRLPKVSAEMAADIVKYRDDQAIMTGDKSVFRTLADVGRVKVGSRTIPKATLEAMAPYLKLVDETPGYKGSGKGGSANPPKIVRPETQPAEPDPD